jgi:hypothetical protein
MSDTEQGYLATLLETGEALTPETTPLQDAAARRQQTERAEEAAQLAFQRQRKDVEAMKAQLRLLELQESRAQSREAIHLLREQAREMATTLHTAQAALTALDKARREANDAMCQAQHGHIKVCELASAAFRQMRRGLRTAADDTLRPVEAMDAEERAEQAFRDLCGLIGEAEATRLRTSTARPAWLRG